MAGDGRTAEASVAGCGDSGQFKVEGAMTTTSQQWTDQSLEVAGCRLALMTAGTGPPVLILHHDIGGAGWIPLYDRLAQQFTVYVPSHPGYDQSERPDWMRSVRDVAVVYQCAIKSLGLDLIPGSGLLAPCVPGAVDGWLLMLRDYGTIDIADALAPAIHYAEHGAPLVPRVIDTIATVQTLFQDEWKTSGALWLDKTGALPKPYALFRQPGHANYRPCGDQILRNFLKGLTLRFRSGE